MKYYLDKINSMVFTITNFEYSPREGQDEEISKDDYDNFINSLDDNQTEEQRANYLRGKRRILLAAFDKWEKAVLRGREEDSLEIMNWYYNLLDLNEIAFENIPLRVRYYL